MAIALSTFPLAQLVDALETWQWNALFVGGMLAPLVGLIISLLTKSMTTWKRTAVVIFYVLSLPLAGLVFLAHTENPAGVCSLIILMPIGMILGLAVLAPRARVD